MNKKIKVLQVIPRLGFGGAETGCYDLAHFLPEKGAKSYIINSFLIRTTFSFTIS